MVFRWFFILLALWASLPAEFCQAACVELASASPPCHQEPAEVPEEQAECPGCEEQTMLTAVRPQLQGMQILMLLPRTTISGLGTILQTSPLVTRGLPGKRSNAPYQSANPPLLS